jgi:hypothetical protein
MQPQSKIPVKQYSTAPIHATKDSEEARYWKSLQYPILKSQLYVVSSIDFNPEGPHEFAITAGRMIFLVFLS